MIEFGCDTSSKTLSHNRPVSQNIQTKHDTSRPKFYCNFCSFSCFTKFSLSRHIKAKHSKPCVQSEVKCPLCSEIRLSKNDMVNHFANDHDISVICESLEFSTEEEFFNWKSKMEKDQVCEFVVWRSKYVSKKTGSSKMVFRCHRDGYFKSESKNKRHKKILGSNKINGHCPAKIDVIFHKPHKITVSFYKTHVGHQSDLCRVRLSEVEKKDIASKIAMKVPFDKILNDIRLSTAHDEMERIHLLTRKDLFNIKQQYNLKSEAVPHANVCTSVDSWIHEMESVGGVVHFYKPQSIPLEAYPQLLTDDFVLVIMNEAQQEMLKKYGNNYVCFESTHGLNSYGFELVTLLVLDDMFKGFPCAFMLSNRCDTCVIEIFLSVIRIAIAGALQPNVFMSDVSDDFYNAWVKIMERPKFHLFCSWHVDHAWRKNLSRVKGREKQAETYKLLRTLLQEADKEAFYTMLDQVIIELKSNLETREFGEYFEKEYKDTAANWAYCNHLHAGLNTKHLERMRCALKQIYIGGKIPKRLDAAIDAIMRFVRDKLYDCLIVLNKGTITSKLSTIRKRHDNSLLLSTDDVIYNEDVWTFSSKSRSELHEIRATPHQDCNCDLRCADCKACIHAYICTCSDSSVKFNMCKHIHLISRFKLNNTTVENTEELSNGCDASLVIPDLPYFEEEETVGEELHNCISQESENMDECKKKLQRQFESILDLIETVEDVEIIEKQIQPIPSTIHARKSKATFLTVFTSPAAKTMRFETQSRLNVL